MQPWSWQWLSNMKYEERPHKQWPWGKAAYLAARSLVCSAGRLLPELEKTVIMIKIIKLIIMMLTVMVTDKMTFLKCIHPPYSKALPHHQTQAQCEFCHCPCTWPPKWIRRIAWYFLIRQTERDLKSVVENVLCQPTHSKEVMQCLRSGQFAVWAE